MFNLRTPAPRLSPPDARRLTAVREQFRAGGELPDQVRVLVLDALAEADWLAGRRRLWFWERRRAAEVPNVLEMAWYALLGSIATRSSRSRFEEKRGDALRGYLTVDEIRRSQGFPSLAAGSRS